MITGVSTRTTPAATSDILPLKAPVKKAILAAYGALTASALEKPKVHGLLMGRYDTVASKKAPKGAHNAGKPAVIFLRLNQDEPGVKVDPNGVTQFYVRYGDAVAGTTAQVFGPFPFKNPTV